MSNPDTISKQHQRNWAWLWLAYTGFLFIDPIVEPSLRVWLGTLAVFAVFLGIFASYVRATDAGQPTRYWMIAATFLLGLIAFPWNGGASTFFVYTAAFLPFTIRSIRRVLLLYVAECLVIIAEAYFFRSPGHLFHIYWPNVVVALFLVLIIGGGNILFAEQKRAECRLRAAQEENAKLAAIAERERIARDLHDVLGHTLSVIVLKAELAKRLIHHDPQRAAQEISDVESTARTALAEVRETIGGFRSQGLTAELQRARHTLNAAGVVLTCNADSPQLSAEEETVLTLSLREAITNIVRHAEATHCNIQLTSNHQHLILRIDDDGTHAINHEGNGLRGMRERVNSLGGTLAISSGQDTAPGTAILIELPSPRTTSTATQSAAQPPTPQGTTV